MGRRVTIESRLSRYGSMNTAKGREKGAHQRASPFKARDYKEVWFLSPTDKTEIRRQKRQRNVTEIQLIIVK